MNNYFLAGFKDARDQKPWRNAPCTFDEWRAGVPATPADFDYWTGFAAALEDRFGEAQRTANKEQSTTREK